MNTPMTSAAIEAQLKALAEHTAIMDDEACDLSLAAVSGDTEAAKRLGEIQREISRAAAEKTALDRAHVAAIKREAEAAERNGAADRAAALDEARHHAGEIVALAATADALIAQFRTLMGDIDTAERAAHGALRRSGVANPGLVGSNGLVEFVLTRLDIAVRGTLLSDKRSVEQIATAGWSFLPELETDETEAA